MQDGTARGAGAPNLRGLKALVIGLGVLIVLGTALVIGVVAKRLIVGHKTPHQAASMVKEARLSTKASFATALPGGANADIAGVAAAGGLFAVWMRNDAGGKVVFIDPRTGRVIGTAAPSR